MNEYLRLFHETMREHMALQGDDSSEPDSPLLRLHLSLKIVPLRRIYSWAIPTDEALQTIADVSPLGVVEVGCGTGYWASLLHQKGVDVAAFDWAPAFGPRLNGHHAVPAGFIQPQTQSGESPGGGALNLPPFMEVEEGGPEKAGSFPGRTLLLCWPPAEVEAEGGSSRVCTMAVDSLKSYGGSTLVYVGVGGAELEDFSEGESGESRVGGDVTAGPQFRHLLGKEWRKTKQVALPNWPTCHDDISVWTRRVRIGAKIGGGSFGQSCDEDSPRLREGRGREGDGCGTYRTKKIDFSEGSRLRGEVLRSFNRMWEDAVVGHVMTKALRGGEIGRSSQSQSQSQPRSQKLTSVERKVLHKWGERGPLRQKLMLWPLLWVKNML